MNFKKWKLPWCLLPSFPPLRPPCSLCPVLQVGYFITTCLSPPSDLASIAVSASTAHPQPKTSARRRFSLSDRSWNVISSSVSRPPTSLCFVPLPDPPLCSSIDLASFGYHELSRLSSSPVPLYQQRISI